MRGARQVGKTWLVRELTRQSQLELIELNLERTPGEERLFESNDPQRILGEFSLARGRTLQPTRSLLFIDEIQSAPALLGKLRWFAESLPELPVVAAGSLLEFALRDPDLRMPVGRVSYLGVAPLSFDEYLLAHDQRLLLDHLLAWRLGEELASSAHAKATEWFHRFVMVGGMPAVVAADAEGRPPSELRQLQSDLVATFRDDFARYSRRRDPQVLSAVLDGIVAMLGRKLVMARIGDGLKQHAVRDALELLTLARLCHPVTHVAANGLPLGGEAKPSMRKLLLLDVGLAHALLGTPAATIFPRWRALSDAVRAQLAEQVVGQELHRISADRDGTTRLHYWNREGGRPGEVNFLVAVHDRITPIELKSGKAGAMKSLHQFMFDKGLSRAVRFDENPPSRQFVNVKTTQGDAVRYELVNLPHYLAWRLLDLL